MTQPAPRVSSLTEADLAFVIEQAAPDAKDARRLGQLVQEDEHFRRAILSDERVFRRVMDDEEVLLKVSPTLYFEVLLRAAQSELEASTHTVERAGRQSIPVFDSAEVADLLGRPGLLEYLADMLASFTRVHSYTVLTRVRRGTRRRIRYNDMDVDSLQRFCAAADESQRLGFYKRIADVCLLITGIFSGHTSFRFDGDATGRRRGGPRRRTRRSLEEYEEEGRRFYLLAEQHPGSTSLDLSPVFGLLRRHFSSARKPLNFIATQYLNSRKQYLFGAETG